MRHQGFLLICFKDFIAIWMIILCSHNYVKLSINSLGDLEELEIKQAYWSKSILLSLYYAIYSIFSGLLTCSVLKISEMGLS